MCRVLSRKEQYISLSETLVVDARGSNPSQCRRELDAELDKERMRIQLWTSDFKLKLAPQIVGQKCEYSDVAHLSSRLLLRIGMLQNSLNSGTQAAGDCILSQITPDLPELFLSVLPQCSQSSERSRYAPKDVREANGSKDNDKDGIATLSKALRLDCYLCFPNSRLQTRSWRCSG